MIGFSLDAHPHLWESLRLILPNPVLRSANTRLVPRGDSEDLGVTLVPRAGVSLEGLHVTIWEERDKLVQRLVEFSPTQSRTLVKLDGIREATGLTVDSQEHDRLVVRGAYPFIKQIVMTFDFATSTRKIRAQRQGKPPVEYDVSVRGRPEESIVGEPKTKGAIDTLRAFRIKTDGTVPPEDEFWFHKDVNAGQRKLREIVGRGRNRVWVVDYFFGPVDVGVLLPAIRTLNAEIRVLTSREGLKNDIGAVDGLSEMLEKVRAELRMQHIEARAMTGEAEIHDRFLVVDDDVYLFGSSVNNFGARGTMLIRLKHPAVVEAAIGAAWLRAEEISVASKEVG